MNTVPQITPGSITGITGLTNRPVFFLKIGNVQTENLVVKGEQPGANAQSNSETEISVVWGSKLMKNVNNNLVNTKIMSATEIAIFKQVAAASFPNGSPQWKNVTQANYLWVKMPYVAGLSDGEFYNNKQLVNGKAPGAYSTSMTKDVIVKLSDDKVWKDLGKVLAVDIFNGNSDRFDINTGAWANMTNLMFVKGGATKVIGLDTFDPNAKQTNLSSKQSNLAKAGTFDELKTLIDPIRRKKFAEDCCRGVGTELQLAMKRMEYITISMKDANGGSVIRKIKQDEFPDMFVPYAPDLEAGLKDGADELKSYLQKKVRQYNAQLPPPPSNTPWQRAAPNKNLPTPPKVMPPLPPTPGQWKSATPNRTPPSMPPLPPTPGQWKSATPNKSPNMPPLPQIPNQMPPLPAPPTQAQAAQAPALKTIPQGVLDRMNFLGW